jgi:hypothetical protein
MHNPGKRSSVFAFLFLVSSLLGACPCNDTTTTPTGLTTSPPAPPEYRQLNFFESEVTLPALFAGDQQQLSKGCFAEMTDTSSGSLDTLSRDYVGQRKFEAGLKIALEKAFVKAGVDASILDQIKQSWTFEARNLVLHKVDPVKVLMNFTNETCNEQALGWFKDEGAVVTALLVAGEIDISAQVGLNQQQKAALEAAIATLGTEAAVNVSNRVVTDESFSMTGQNLAIGALVTHLEVKRCTEKWRAQPGQRREVCGGKYRVTVAPASVPDRFTLTVSAGNQSGQWDEAYLQPKAHGLGTLRVVSADVTQQLDVVFEGLFAGTSNALSP